MIGGAMIAEGGFGCVFHPAIPCSTDEGEEDEYISKIVKKDFNSENEIKMADKIRKINNWRSYFNVVTNSCDTDISEIDAGERDKCESFKKYPEKEFVILRMPYIKGSPLAIHLSDDKLNELTRQRENLQGYIFLLEGIDKLINARIVHNDIKSGNILFDTSIESPIIIDFGLSFEVSEKSGLFPVKNFNEKNIYKYFYIYAPDYYLWAPEIHLINYLLHVSRYINKDTLKTIVNDIVDKNKIFQTYFSKAFTASYKKALLEEFYFLLNKYSKPIDLINALIKDGWYTWDNFSLSIFYIKFIRFTYGQQPIVENKYILALFELLVNNISPFIKRRLTPKNTIKKFMNWLEESGASGGQEIINYRKIQGKNPRLYVKNLVSSDITELKDITTRKNWIRKITQRGD